MKSATWVFTVTHEDKTLDYLRVSIDSGSTGDNGDFECELTKFLSKWFRSSNTEITLASFDGEKS